jgi:diguanylate cyclase
MPDTGRHARSVRANTEMYQKLRNSTRLPDAHGSASHAQVLDALSELHSIVTYHVDWLKTRHSALLKGRVPDEADLAPDAHHNCRFGKWYTDQSNPLLRECDAFAEVGSSHKDMHLGFRQLARRLADGDLSSSDLMDFMDRAINFHEAIRHLQYEIWSQLVDTDPLTGLYNRRTMFERLGTEASRCQRNGDNWCVAMIDIDHFKDINDRLGHVLGDRVLQHTTGVLTEFTRPYDQLYRYGGEEFLLCMPDTDLEAACMVLQRLREHLARNPVTLEDADGPVVVQISCGVTLCSGEHPLEKNIDHADQALYRAKQNGRDQVTVWSGK